MIKHFNIDFKKSYLNSIFSTTSAIWFKKDLTKKFKETKTKLPVEFDFDSTSQSIDWLKKQKIGWLVNSKEINTALECNHFWPSVKINDEIIGCIKIGFKKVYIADYNELMEFPDKMAFIYDTFVLKEYRGKGVGRYLISQAAINLKSRDYISLGCHIPPWNKASIKAFEKNGFKKIKYVRNFKVLGVAIKIANNSGGFSIVKGGKITYEELPY